MKIQSFAAALSLCLGVGAASAGVVTFDELSSNDTRNLGTSFSSGGFSFANNCGTTGCLMVWARGDSFQADRGHAAVFVNYPNTTTTMTRVGGGGFDFNSIDLADVYNAGSSVQIRFDFLGVAGASSSQTIALDALRGLQTFSFNQTALQRVSWTTVGGANGWNQFDNIVTDAVRQDVPEPASLALALLALGGVAATSRRRKNAG